MVGIFTILFVCAYLLLIFVYFYLFFFFNDTATTEIYTLSLHDALPIYKIELSFLRIFQEANQLSSSERKVLYNLLEGDIKIGRAHV